LERRRAQRLNLQCQVKIRWSEGANMREVSTLSENISSNGLYCSLADDLKAGESVEVEVTLPDQISKTGMVRVHCFGHIQRCEVKSSGKRGMAVAFDKFEFLAAD
jgi:hypothetical protein